MPIAAVPNYLGKDFENASPGMRFGMYLKLWGVNRRTNALLWETHDIDYEVRGKNREEREVKKENKISALADAKRLSEHDKDVMKAIAERQAALAQAVTGKSLLCLDAKTIAPFTTGLGNEHPLENGFAFLNPYGLPYLPGSGVKGVLRQAAQELASGDWGDTKGWSTEPSYTLMTGEGDERRSVIDEKTKEPVTFSMLDALFGLESQEGEKVHIRGALTFWDVIPQIKGDSLMVEIMTPHQSHYYQQKKDKNTGDSTSPHDSGQPRPLSYLTVPPGSGFSFIVTCDLVHLNRLAPELAQNEKWKEPLKAAFEHAFQWLGFGAKTAVGYGAMRRDHAAELEQARRIEERERMARKAAEAERLAKEREAELAKLDPVERSIREFLDGRPDKNQPEISAVIGAVKQRRWQDDEKIAVARWLKNKMQKDNKVWKESSHAKKPEKDRDYQNTLLVKSWLEGKS